VYRRHLKTARGILKIDHDRRALRHVLLSRCRKRGCVTESIIAAFQRDEAIAFCGVEPFDRPFDGSLCKGTRTAVVEVCHDEADKPAGAPFRWAHPSSGMGQGA
jgi:hypothetical protein